MRLRRVRLVPCHLHARGGGRNQDVLSQPDGAPADAAVAVLFILVFLFLVPVVVVSVV